VAQLVFDEAAARAIEAMYGTADARRRRRLVRAALGAAPGERVLDVGCGPGFYVRELLDEVGPAGAVTGVDGSAAMLGLAGRRVAGHANAELHVGDALAVPVSSGAFDAALCVQVLEYVPDAPAALAELHRALRPGGRLVVWDVDWATVSMFADDPELTARVLRAWDEHLAHRSLPRTLGPRLREAGFVDVVAQAHAFAATAFDPDLYGPRLVPLIADFVPGRQGLTADEARAWATEQHALGERGAFFFACLQFCFTARRPPARSRPASP
jgi:arsenite methyltransferase